jgi:hypothetical protein
VKYHYFQRRPTYPVMRNGLRPSSGLNLRGSASGTHTGGEFGWGGTSVKK